jgi:hypothetical protein
MFGYKIRENFSLVKPFDKNIVLVAVYMEG